MKVAILLTTYNSSQFLDEQIRSLQEQTYEHWDLYVRDDQSSDSTPALLEAYAQSDPRIHLLPEAGKRGAMSGFMWLLEQVEADYYMFCDHDDVWKSDKVATSLSAMLDCEDRDARPIVVHTDLEVVDAQLHLLHASFWQSQRLRAEEFGDKYYHLAYNNIPGCTMMLNRKAREVSLPCHPAAGMHDSWIAAAVLWRGGYVKTIHQPGLLYRQHGKNTIGAHEVPSFASKFGRIKQLWKKLQAQAAVAQTLSGMSLPRFLCLKLKYMLNVYYRKHHSPKS